MVDDWLAISADATNSEFAAELSVEMIWKMGIGAGRVLSMR